MILILYNTASPQVAQLRFCMMKFAVVIGSVSFSPRKDRKRREEERIKGEETRRLARILENSSIVGRRSYCNLLYLRCKTKRRTHLESLCDHTRRVVTPPEQDSKGSAFELSSILLSGDQPSASTGV